MSHKSYRIEPLYKILEQEKASGFRDTTVIGGLDLFLQRWADDLKPILGEFSSYSILTPLQRKKWIEKVFDHKINSNLSSIDGKFLRVDIKNFVDSAPQSLPITQLQSIFTIHNAGTSLFTQILYVLS